jgi:ketosteroid isomerase-like protein
MYGELTRRRRPRDARAHDDHKRSARVLRARLEPYDVDLLMTFMAEDCVFDSTAGPEACGTRHAGREPVRRAFEVFPDARFAEARHLVAGDRGLSEWRFTGTTVEGKMVEVDGCDLFTFAGDEIARKSSYFKTRTP